MARQDVLTTTCGATDDDKVSIMTTPCVQWTMGKLCYAKEIVKESSLSWNHPEVLWERPTSICHYWAARWRPSVVVTDTLGGSQWFQMDLGDQLVFENEMDFGKYAHTNVPFYEIRCTTKLCHLKYSKLNIWNCIWWSTGFKCMYVGMYIKLHIKCCDDNPLRPSDAYMSQYNIHYWLR